MSKLGSVPETTKQLHLNVNSQEAALIIQALGELQAKYVYGLITKLETEIAKQLAKPEVATGIRGQS